MQIMTKTRAFLKWAGSKYNCITKICAHLPKGQRLIEPFAGSGVVFMNTNYSSYLLAESNPDLIQLYTYLQQQGDVFIDYCASYFTAETNLEQCYYSFREQFNRMELTEERAAIFLYLNRHGYNGLCRYNSKGQYNVPFGRYKKPYFPRHEMTLFHQKSAQVTFSHNDFRHTLIQAQVGDVVYCDPPYVPIAKQTRILPYTQKKFTEADQIELAVLAQATAQRGIPVIISNHDTEFTRAHYKSATIKSFPVSRWINCQADLRQPAQELIAIFQ